MRTTVTLFRKEAERLFIDLKTRRKFAKWQAQASKLSVAELEAALEALNDEVCGGDGYEKYRVLS